MKEKKDGQDRIIVDIDNTLWYLAPELWEELKKVNPQMPPPDQWGTRASLEKYMPLKEFFRVLKIIHMRQETYPPFPESQYFLNALKERGFYIVIASHRSQDSYGPTVNWLKKHQLLFDEVHLSYDKSVLFSGSLVLVDDSPINLDKAVEAGLLGTGLIYPWNEKSGHPLFKNLIKVLGYLDSKLPRPKEA
jgi:hypothetical protein